MPLRGQLTSRTFGNAGRFGATFKKSRKVMPHGLMALLGTVGVIVTALGLLEH